MYETGQLTVLNIADILPNRFQPRIKFDTEKLEELAESINKYGVIQPVVVRKVSDKYEIIAGERRFKASKIANKSTIPAIIVNLSDKDSEEIALLENIQREQLSPIEEAVSYKRILDMGYVTQEQLAQKVGKTQSTIANKIRLLNLDDEVQSYLLNNKISERHARSLLRLSNKNDQVDLLHRIVEERLTVKQTDKEIEKIKEQESIKDINRESIFKPNVANKSKNVMNYQSSNQSKTDDSEIEDLFAETDSKEKGNQEFMDIEKIMRDAKDINVDQPQVKDISNLMAPGNAVQNEPIVTETPQPVQTEPSKFINIVPPKPEEKAPVENTINSGVTFDSIFNQEPTSSNLNNQTNTISNSNNDHQPQNQQPASFQAAPKDLSQPDFATSNVNNNQAEVSNDTKSEISNAVADAFKKYTPNNSFHAESNQINQPNYSANVAPIQQPTEPINVAPIQQPTEPINVAPVQQPVEPINAVPVQQPVEPINVAPVQQPVEPINVAPVQQPAEPINVAPIQQPVVQNNISSQPNISNQVIPDIPDIPDTNIYQDNVNSSIPNSQNTSNSDVEDSGNGQTTMASAIAQNVKPVNNAAHFAQVVKLLRNCAAEIENLGYHINTDEIDMGNQYKVSFIIDKE
jgi:ParB family chromosome partitioning protein